MSDDAMIESRKNGPLMARNLGQIQDEDGSDLAVKPVMALCRCGQSKNKPFCDGSHKGAGFKTGRGKLEGADRFFAYEGAEVTVSFNPRLCSHAAECGRLASHIFNPEQKPWVQPDQGTLAEVQAVVAACPSGALQYSTTGAAPETLLAERPAIMVQKDGPYWVTGVPIADDPGAVGQSGEKYVLCRCGLSGNKPFCDGTHRDKGWKSD